MKLRKFVLREGMNELHASELKLLKGGTDGLVAACNCKCDKGVGYWTLYTSNGECTTLGTRPSEFCETTATCSPL